MESLGKKGALLTTFFLYVGFVIVYVLFGYDFITWASYWMIDEHNLEGLAAFIVANFNLWLPLISSLAAILGVLTHEN